MFIVTEEDAAAIRAAFERNGELSAVVELRQRFPAFTDNAKAQEWVRTIAGWKPLPVVFRHGKASSLAMQTAPKRPE